MKKVAILVVAVLAIMALGGTRATYAQPETVTVNMTEQNGSGQNGTATLTTNGDTTMVMINISGGSSTPQPAHIHPGTCADLDPKPIYPLTSVVNGTSETTVPASLVELVNGTFAINVHKSGPEASVYVSCGDIPNMFATGGGTSGGGTTVGMPRTGSPDLTFVTLLALLGASLTGVGLKLARRKI
jgi:Cu/Zn superoxide dismutase